MKDNAGSESERYLVVDLVIDLQTEVRVSTQNQS